MTPNTRACSGLAGSPERAGSVHRLVSGWPVSRGGIAPGPYPIPGHPDRVVRLNIVQSIRLASNAAIASCSTAHASCRTAAAMAQEAKPGLPVIYVTGYNVSSRRRCGRHFLFEKQYRLSRPSPRSSAR